MIEFDSGSMSSDLIGTGASDLGTWGRRAYQAGRLAGRYALRSIARNLGASAWRAFFAKAVPWLILGLGFLFLLMFAAAMLYVIWTDVSRTHAFTGNEQDPLNQAIESRYVAAAAAVAEENLRQAQHLACVRNGAWREHLESLTTPWELLAALDLARELPMDQRSEDALKEMARAFPFEVRCADMAVTVRTAVYRDGTLVREDGRQETVSVIERVTNWQGEQWFHYTRKPVQTERSWTEAVTDPETGETRQIHYREVTTREEPELIGITSNPTYEPVRAYMQAPVAGEPVLAANDIGFVIHFLNQLQGDEELFEDPVLPGFGMPQPPGMSLELPITSTGMVWPVETTRISSPFGPRVHPITGRYKLHKGVDVPVPTGTPVATAQAGTVSKVVYSSTGYGIHVVIDHGGGIQTLYAHLSQALVLQGQRVEAGQVIALSGNTGASTGPHLHFEVRINGHPVNPLKFYPDLFPGS